ncbi:MAG: DUF3667 domain-containing protein [Sediminibacterium sp.]|uniref:DUF3667 domain-containing protein n=1 Tax=Sediminibacterium sp. TaxID=1917865 RepID=UPI002ABA16B7|nr:DUF3667 domain-containing protein [Sediminibacterium sp.]MDZ4070383.1 DUF3667 domain-containing protein [Sediminibacterium sp.]
MSHLPERKEKICLNCGAALHGRFCHYCGQENIEPKDSFWHLVTHFVYDIIHFDGKFFSTLKYLLFRPGFLSHEYLRGRRADYLHPIRMYVFTSAFFFLIFFSFYQKEEAIEIKEKRDTVQEVMEDLQDEKARLEKKITNDTIGIATDKLKERLRKVEADMVMLKRDSSLVDSVKSLARGGFTLVSLDNDKSHRELKTVMEYDSIQASLQESNRDGFLKRAIKRQDIHLNEKYKGDGSAILKAVTNKFIHFFPQMLFISLPLFGLLLLLLYVKHKQFFYVNHVIYSIHLYCALFIIILVGLWLNSILTAIIHSEHDWIGGSFTLAGFFYIYKSMRNFYGQRRAITILKYILLLLLSLFVMVLLFGIFFLFSAFVL